VRTGFMQAEGRRSRGGRSVASRLGRPPRLQGCSERLRKTPDEKARRHPPPGHYEPGAPIGR
jgi:hypothetical protein